MIGRKGTGKSTIFQRAQHQIRQQKRSISAYVDIKTVFETSTADTDLTKKVAGLGAAQSGFEIERILLYRSFTKAVFEDVQKELRNQVSSSVVQKFKEAIAPRRHEVIEAIDDLLDGAFEAELTM